MNYTDLKDKNEKWLEDNIEQFDRSTRFLIDKMSSQSDFLVIGDIMPMINDIAKIFNYKVITINLTSLDDLRGEIEIHPAESYFSYHIWWEEEIRQNPDSSYLLLFVLDEAEQRLVNALKSIIETHQHLNNLFVGCIWRDPAKMKKSTIDSLVFGMDCDFLFKKSNRDNSKYRVSYNGDYIFPEKQSLSKEMTALAIFHAYVRKNQDKDLSVHDLNKAFPCKDLNEYYYKNYYKDIFYPYAEQLHFDSDNKTQNGKDSRAVWDFHVKPSQLLEVSNGTQKVMAVKMWRKSDFERLLAHVMAHQEWFDGITIEEVRV